MWTPGGYHGLSAEIARLAVRVARDERPWQPDLKARHCDRSLCPVPRPVRACAGIRRAERWAVRGLIPIGLVNADGNLFNHAATSVMDPIFWTT
jgi:hypothetical protein